MHIGTYHFGIMNLVVFEYVESKCFFIEQNMKQRKRIVKLNQIAIHQMSIFESGDIQTVSC